jgi:hypothetical protein
MYIQKFFSIEKGIQYTSKYISELSNSEIKGVLHIADVDDMTNGRKDSTKMFRP